MPTPYKYPDDVRSILDITPVDPVLTAFELEHDKIVKPPQSGQQRLAP